VSDKATRQLLDGLISHLEALRDDGARWVGVSPALLAEATGPLSRPRIVHREDARPPGTANTRAAGIAMAPDAIPTPTAAPPMAPPARPALDGPAMDRNAKVAALSRLQAKAKACVQCAGIARARTSVVFGVGDPDAALMLVGEAPGRDEDRQGEPFVGAAGQLLTKILVAMGLGRDHVYIANVLKCRPDTPGEAFGNRKPTADEMATCIPFLFEQVRIVRPRVIVALGGTALEGLLGQQKLSVTRMRGRWADFAGVPLMPTYHPSYLLRQDTLATKREVWEDMLAVMEKLGLPISTKQRAYFTKA
jgi:DNA polymerase